MIALETRSLCKSFGSLAVTQDVSLAFEASLRYAIIGPNGAGKTTYFNLLAGNLRPDSGAVLLADRDVTRLDVTARARIGIARSFQRNSLFPELTVRDNLALACEPRVLLLDEPTSGMSPEETARMHALIKQLPRTLTVIVIEHDMDIVLDFADRIIVLDYGRVLEQGTPADIRNSQVVRERYLGEHAFGGAGGHAPGHAS